MCHAPRISAILHLRRFRPSPNIRASGARQRPTRSWTTRQLAQAQCESKVAAPRRGLGRGVLNPHVALLLLRPERAHKRCKRCVCACVTHTSSIGVVARFGALKCAADRSTDLVRFAFGTRAQHAKLPLSGRAKRGTMQATAHVSRHTPTRPQLGTCTVPPKEAGGREPARTIEPPLVVCRILVSWGIDACRCRDAPPQASHLCRPEEMASLVASREAGNIPGRRDACGAGGVDGTTAPVAPGAKCGWEYVTSAT